ncbi:unnamed protein product [Prorocentrum cordatum]|uniref:Uncharacterized protein n=1 Tax=Prorocentrum cordatum TaxID=2364126 RepID=A0ABN9R1U4_9DINO|nr:unnamed protein product [Polarella glacialis]
MVWDMPAAEAHARLDPKCRLVQCVLLCEGQPSCSRGRSQGTPERRPDCSETAPRRGRGSRFARRGPGARRMRACETAPPGDAWAKGLAAGFLRTSYPAQTSRTRARETTSGRRREEGQEEEEEALGTD